MELEKIYKNINKNIDKKDLRFYMARGIYEKEKHLIKDGKFKDISVNVKSSKNKDWVLIKIK